MEDETILVIEDDRDVAQLLGTALAMQHFTPVLVHDGGRALREACRAAPSLILLDLMLPTLDGWEVCRRLRADEATRHIPIIIVTAKGDEDDRLAGLKLGADDYVAKPFSTRELIARIRAILRRKKLQASEAGSRLRVGNLEIDVDRYTVTAGGTPVHLTRTEFSILRLFAVNPGQVFTRDQLLTSLWGADCYLQEHNLDVHMSSIRKKIEADPDQPRYLQTVRGVGYKLKGDE